MSLRARVLAGIAAIAVVLVVAAVGVTRSTQRYLVDQVDDRLRSTDGGFLFGPGGRGPGGFGRFSDLYVAVVDDTGAVVQDNSQSFADRDDVPVVDAAAVAGLRDGALLTLDTADADVHYRAIVKRSGGPFAGGGTGDAGDADDGRVLVALPLTDVDDAVSRLVFIEVLVTVGTIGVLGLVGWWVVRLGVRPVKRMTETASAIAAGDLSARVPEGRAGTEAGELGVALNQMLGRIEAAFDERARSQDRLRQFVADASHELRTPVTTIRGYAELYRAGALDDREELGEAMRRTEQEAIRMGSLVEDLLQLARLDQGRPMEQAPVDLAAVVEDAARDARAVDPDRTVTVVRPDGPPPVVLGDDARLRQVVANLVGNALVHTPSGAPLELRVGSGDGGGGAWLEVADHGPGMPPEVATRAFERFYRADPSRSRHKGGSGLGLSIVEATVGAHGGKVALTSEVGVGTTVRIDLPGRTAG